MKKILRNTMMMLLGMMLLAGCSMDNRIIEKPVFLASNTTSIEVSKVTLTDSTTVLDIFARYQPKYWIRIASSSYLTDDKGKTYPVQSGIGINLDKEFWMPESGEAEFQLVFPRLRNGAKYFDFAEGPEVQGGFNIWGVQLKSNELPELKLPKAMLAQEVDKEAPLEVPELKYGEAIIKGKVLDYQPGMPTTLKIIAYNPLVGYDGDMDVDIESDGTFEHKMNVWTSSKAYIYYTPMQRQAEIYVEAGQVSEVCLNMREASRLNSKFHVDAEPYGKLYYYNGPMENVIRELPNVQDLLKGIQNESVKYNFDDKPEALLEIYKNNLLASVKKGKEALAQSSLGKSVKLYKEKELDFELLTGLQNAPSRLAYERIMSQPEIDRQAYMQDIMKLQQACPSDYIAKESYAILNEPISLLYSSYYGNMVGGAEMFRKKYGLEEGLCTQLNLAAGLFRRIKDFAPLTDAQKEEMKALPEACQQYLIAENDKLLETIEANKKKTGFRVNEAGEVANEDLFASIISQFRGKVLLVDFWATWCGPCRMANKEMAPMKEELKDKDIVYVYITGETSPKGTWEHMIPDIHGEHFRVTDAQWSYLGKAMGIDGVPTYFIIDREGNIKFKTVGFPGVSKMKEELNKVLESK